MRDDSAWCKWEGGDLILRVRVQPRASRDGIVGPQQGSLKVRLTTPPVEGRANEHLISLLSGVFGVPARQVTLLSGHTGREKRLRIESPKTLPAWIAPGS
jgi:uncharacterized protein